MKKLALLSLVLFASCDDQNPEKISNSSNSHYQIEELFTYDSIKVYKFRDGLREHYFVRDMTSSVKACGKGCTYNEEIKTIK